MSQDINTSGKSIHNVDSSLRDLALEGLIIETFNRFDFFQDEEGEVCVELEIDECTDVLEIHSVTFEILYGYFAQSMGLNLTDDEFIVALIKIEHFIQGLEDEFVCDDCTEKNGSVC